MWNVRAGGGEVRGLGVFTGDLDATCAAQRCALAVEAGLCAERAPLHPPNPAGGGRGGGGHFTIHTTGQMLECSALLMCTVPRSHIGCGGERPLNVAALRMIDCEAGQRWQGSGRHRGRRLPSCEGGQPFLSHPQTYFPHPTPPAAENTVTHCTVEHRPFTAQRHTSTKHNQVR